MSECEYHESGEHEFERQRDPQTGLLLGVCECGVIVDHNGDEL